MPYKLRADSARFSYIQSKVPEHGLQNFMFKFFLIFLPSIILLLPIVLSTPDLTLLPSERKFRVKVYDDHADSSGNSMCSLSKATDSIIIFNYTLRKADNLLGKDPYAGFIIDVPRNDTFFDISLYKYINIEIVTQQATSFNIHLKTFIEGYTVYDSYRTYHTETYQVPVHIGSKRYSIPLEYFQIPEWWYKEVGTKAASLPRKADYTKFFGINFHSGPGMTLDVPDQFTITKISFSTKLPEERKKSVLLWTSGFIVYNVLAFLILFIILKRFKKSNGSKIPYQPIDIQSHSVEEAERLTNYIGTHFQEPELTVEKVGRETGISPARIPLILQQKHKMAFKPYLNEVRITEAKRLLKETDRTITEIAFAVGYNNIPHFNRVFREDVGVAPTAFRENKKA
jgi:AraC-like DNA-binding protein